MMTYDPACHHRRSVRLQGYDYASAGAYFVTIVAQGHACLFGQVVDRKMRLNDAGRIVHDEWLKSPEMRPRVMLDQFAVMPNHIHDILILVGCRGTWQRAPTGAVEGVRGTWQRAPTGAAEGVRGTWQRAPTEERFGKPTSDSIPTIIRLFKSATTQRINTCRKTPGATVWQRGYFEHIIRNADSLSRIRRYIAENPTRWAFDRENPDAISPEPEYAWARR